MADISMRKSAFLVAGLLTVMLAACGSSEEPPEVVEQIVVREPGAPVQAAPSGEAATTDLVAMGEDAFQMCTGCHAFEAGAPSAAGPNLYGVVGRVAGSLDDFPYSDALAASKRSETSLPPSRPELEELESSLQPTRPQDIRSAKAKARARSVLHFALVPSRASSAKSAGGGPAAGADPGGSTGGEGGTEGGTAGAPATTAPGAPAATAPPSGYWFRTLSTIWASLTKSRK